jgi:hypothetical protein
MPPTPLTIECRAVADRMFNAVHTSGNTQCQHKLVYEDSKTLMALRTELETLNAPSQEIANAQLAIQRVSNVMECEGNPMLAHLLSASAAWVIVACNALDGEAPPTKVIGISVGMNKQPDPLVMLDQKPLDPDVQSMAHVLVTGSGWPSIEGKRWAANIVSAALSQFRLMGADTTGEQGGGAGATFAVEIRP